MKGDSSRVELGRRRENAEDAGGLLVLERTQLIARAREEAFAVFADALNLEAITPPWLGFEVLTPEPIFDFRAEAVSRLLG